MSFWGKLFGSDEALKSVVDGVASGLDKLVYTEQEKVEAAAAERTEARAMIVKWMESTQGQNLARRIISLAITGVWLSFYVMAAFFYSLGIFLEDSAKIKELAGFLFSMANSLADPVMLILAFYFAAPYMGNIVEALLKKPGGITPERKG